MKHTATSFSASGPFNHTYLVKRPENKISIVVADDNADDQLLIQDAFKNIDQNIEYAAVYNGQQLVDLISSKGVYASSYKFSPDAIILDLSMPVMDGLTALKIIRQIKEFNTISIYILHTARYDDYLNQCSSLGVKGIFTKPSAFIDLKTIIENIYYSCGGSRKKSAT
jgi:two-component system response regulator